MRIALIASLILAQTDPSSSDIISPFIDQIVGLSGYGLLLLGLLTDQLHTKKAYSKVEADRDAWKTAYHTEHDLRVDADQEVYRLSAQVELSNDLLNAIKNGTPPH